MELLHLVLLSSALALLIVLGTVEVVIHRRNLAKIPIRVHVNGTRGKSSVSRLIAAGMRAGGIRTSAKITGVLPRMILPDGREVPVYRPSRANVIEQKRIVATAAAFGSEALVIECMALQPPLQWLCENKLVRATHGVITNARADHLDVMGPGERDVALALAGMMPVCGKLFTCERKHLDVFKDAAADRRSTVVPVGEEDVTAITEADLAGFPYIEHAENVALALRVCAELGVERDVALRGMWEATPDPGVLIDCDVRFFGRRIVFVNGFAANDPQSTEKLWGSALVRHKDVPRRIALFNCRLDRPDRSLQLGSEFVSWPRADYVMLMGNGTHIFAREAARAGFDESRLLLLEDYSADEIFETILEHAGPAAVVVGMGNIAGPGLELLNFMKNRSTIVEAAA